MADSTEVTSAQDNGDFEKVSHTDDELVTSSSAVSDQGLPSRAGEDADPYERTEMFEARAATKAQLNVGEPATTTTPSETPTTDEKAETASCAACCDVLKHLDPRVVDLLMWRDVKKTGIVFSSALFVLLSLACFSLLSVIAYLSLIVLTITFTFRLYCHVMCSVKKTPETQPFKDYLDMNLTISDETAHHAADVIAKHLTSTAEDLRQLFFVENVVDSLKFALVLWLLTYIGGWFNGMTLIIMAFVSAFTIPKVYDMYKPQIDKCLNQICTKTTAALNSVREKIPKRKQE